MKDEFIRLARLHAKLTERAKQQAAVLANLSRDTSTIAKLNVVRLQAAVAVCRGNISLLKLLQRLHYIAHYPSYRSVVNRAFEVTAMYINASSQCLETLDYVSDGFDVIV